MKNTTTTDKTTFDTTALCDRILMRYESLEEFFDETGVELDKLTGKKELKLEDIIKTRIALHLDRDDTQSIFFPDMEPQDTKHVMFDLLSMEEILKSLEHIESGMMALNMMVAGKVLEVGDEITPESFRDAYSFIADRVTEELTDLRAELTATYFQERVRIGQ